MLEGLVALLARQSAVSALKTQAGSKRALCQLEVIVRQCEMASCTRRNKLLTQNASGTKSVDWDWISQRKCSELGSEAGGASGLLSWNRAGVAFDAPSKWCPVMKTFEAVSTLST